MKLTKYKIQTNKIIRPIKIACVSDLHAHPADKIVDVLKTSAPDLILLAGDILEVSAQYMERRNSHALRFLKEASAIAPCYYCFGNHEIYYSHAKFGHSHVSEPELRKKHMEIIEGYGINVINDAYKELRIGEDSLIIGGLVCGRDMDPALDQKEPDLSFLSEFKSMTDCKILLCHYPQHYDKYLKDTDIDLIVSGHAHGGQWRFFGQGIYSPHQGLFPKYTSGLHYGRLVISRGAVNNSKPIPRLFNPTEILEIELSPNDGIC